MPTKVTDRIPALVALMGQLSLDSTIRECLAVRAEWKAIMAAVGDSATHSDFLLSEAAINKVIASREYGNYREATKGLFGHFERECLDAIKRELAKEVVQLRQRRIDQLVREHR